MTFTFKKATKEQAKLRLALFGPSGSGKTFTALRLSKGLTGKIALIDTERGSASKYADRFDFDVLELGKGSRTIEHYAQAIRAANQASYDILIIDSLSHAWFELLEEVDKVAKAKYRGNTWSAWSEGTPKQRALVDAILDYDGHIIATMRVKTEWTTEQTSSGRSRPVRVGLAPQQGKGIEYEFDVLGEISPDHVMTISKDRTGKFQDRVIDKPGEEIGRELAEWLKVGAVKKRAKKEQAPALDKVTQAAIEDFGGVPIDNTPFANMKEAVDWGFEQGVFKARTHAKNAYTKLKTEKNPQSSEEMARLWRIDVANRVADMEAVKE